MTFAHLHNHSDFSALDGAAEVSEYAQRAAELGIPALALTDHGVLSGAYDFYKSCREVGVHPILGIEAYAMPVDYSRTHREPIRIADGGEDDISGGGAFTHMTLWAENNTGLVHLQRMLAQANTDGFYKKPRIDLDLLKQHNGGILGTTGCPSGEIATLLRLDRYDEARRVASTYRDVLGAGNYYAEIMDHGIGIEKRARDGILRLARDLGLPLIATNDCHYVYPADAPTHDAYLCVQSNAKIADTERFRFEGTGYYLKSPQEMRADWSDLPEACDNTLLIAERCHVDITPREGITPVYPTPAGVTSVQLFSRAVREGLANRLGVHPDRVPQEYKDRAVYEFGVITNMGFADYFLIVADLLAWAREQGILTGPGRGCLSGDTRVATPNGFKNIKDIKPGDLVFDETGTAIVVPQVFEYDCDEELIEIKAFFGRDGNKMTADHKVLVSKANRASGSRLGAKCSYEAEILPPQWIRADEVEVGDLVVMPRLRFPETITGWTFDPNSICQSNTPSRLSSRSIAQDLGLSNATAVRRFVSKNGEVRGPLAERIREHVKALGATVEDCRAARTVTTAAKTSFLPASYEAGQFFGMFISNGWLRSNGQAMVGFAQNRETDTGVYPALVEALFGLAATSSDHPTKNVRQYVINHKGVVSLLRRVFTDYESSAHTKYIPQELLHAPEEFRLGLLHGLWYGDRCHSGKSAYSTVSGRLADDVAMLLLSLGLPAGVKAHSRTDIRAGFAGARTEYKVSTAHYFDTDTMNNSGVGFDGRFTYLRVREVNTVPAEGKVYDFTVPGKNSYVTDSYVVHNSVGGSLVAWAMGITELDPIAHGLLFERFLNPERISMPDIDMDFDDRRRGEVIEYVRDKYGDDKVANIVTYSVIKAKAALKDSARVLGIDYAAADALSKVYPPDIMGKSMPLRGVFDEDHPRHDEAAQFREHLNSNPQILPVFDLASRFEGLKRGYGMHAAGVIMSAQPLTDTVPLMRVKADGPLVTGYEYPACEALGLLKMDFLGLRNLGTIDEALLHINASRDEPLTLGDIIGDLTDTATYELLARGDTLGVFQLDSPQMRALLRSMQPDSFEDISAVLALYRPGPMGANAHNEYADRKNGRKPVAYIHSELAKPLEDILGDTYGLIVYQEQVMRIAQELAGYTLAQADNLRRAMGKKKKEVLDKEFIPFREGMRANKFSDNAIKTLWSVLVPFSDYAFNKAHSAGYGLVSYATAWLKTHHPAEYMAALLTTNSDDKDKTAVYLAEARRMGLVLVPPSVNESGAKYTPSPGTIRVGLGAIRNVGEDKVDSIIKEREENGPYRGFADLLARLHGTCAMNSRVIDSLIRAGALDEFGHARAAMCSATIFGKPVSEGVKYSVDRAVKAAEREALGKKPTTSRACHDEAGVKELATLTVVREGLDAAVEVDLTVTIPNIPEWPRKHLSVVEREMLGLYVAHHPLDGKEKTLRKRVPRSIGSQLTDIDPYEPRPVRVAGMLSRVENKVTRKGAHMGVLTVMDLDGEIECVVFPQAWGRVGRSCAQDSLVMIEGRLDGNGEVKIIVDRVTSLGD